MVRNPNFLFHLQNTSGRAHKPWRFSLEVLQQLQRHLRKMCLLRRHGMLPQVLQHAVRLATRVFSQVSQHRNLACLDSLHVRLQLFEHQGHSKGKTGYKRVCSDLQPQYPVDGCGCMAASYTPQSLCKRLVNFYRQTLQIDLQARYSHLDM